MPLFGFNAGNEKTSESHGRYRTYPPPLAAALLLLLGRKLLLGALLGATLLLLLRGSCCGGRDGLHNGAGSWWRLTRCRIYVGEAWSREHVWHSEAGASSLHWNCSRRSSSHRCDFLIGERL